VLYIAFAEQLNAPLELLYQTRSYKGLSIHNTATFKSLQISYVYYRETPLKNIMETPLRQPSLKGHLTTLKPGPDTAASPGVGTFMPAAGCLAMTGTCTSADTLPFFGSPLRGF